ncbi:phospholipid carrier-dependent glycosyltransferase [Lysobacter sp. HX-5-24]|uniref:Phospholipid carrier-dependent glycosyltransferase n=2 Tax=Noviluteimonas gilva TaxID=2682097 RepID=A0A7C9LFP1_9GAMM|nr:phospholipid carrier-dependent glycosyltransferase [Lysobacter gilvus]
MMDMLRKPTFWVAIIAVCVSLLFLGHRGTWDPDEGRYTNVGLNMLDSGDWLNPRRNEEVGHWTKPPMTYWAIASSVAVFGVNTWAARLPAALSYLLCVWLVWRMARRLSPGSEAAASLAYATMLLTIGASQYITTDFILTAFSTFAMHGFVEARFGDSRRRWWIATLWIGFALAFLTKGPPTLLPLLAVITFDALIPGKQRPRVFGWSALLFPVLALPWYFAVVRLHPGLLEHFLGAEVIKRVASDDFSRHGEWYGFLVVYVPTLLLGTLPWTPTLLRWCKSLPADVRRWWGNGAQRAADAPWVLLMLWIVLPLLVFCLARSRMPLYLLPLFTPLALLVGMQRQREGRALPRWPWIAAWVALVLALQIGAGFWRTHKDASEWADEIRRRAGGQPVTEVIFVEDMTRYGLHLELGLSTHIEKIALYPLPQSKFDRVYDELLQEELDEHEGDALWISKASAWPRVIAQIHAAGYEATPLGAPWQGRMFFRVVRR